MKLNTLDEVKNFLISEHESTGKTSIPLYGVNVDSWRKTISHRVLMCSYLFRHSNLIDPLTGQMGAAERQLSGIYESYLPVFTSENELTEDSKLLKLSKELSFVPKRKKSVVYNVKHVILFEKRRQSTNDGWDPCIADDIGVFTSLEDIEKHFESLPKKFDNHEIVYFKNKHGDLLSSGLPISGLETEGNYGWFPNTIFVLITEDMRKLK